MARVAVAVTEADAVAGDQRRNQVVHDSLNELLQYLDTNSGRRGSADRPADEGLARPRPSAATLMP
jgi:hypothetical protein